VLSIAILDAELLIKISMEGDRTLRVRLTVVDGAVRRSWETGRSQEEFAARVPTAFRASAPR
jgi:hypothetical protein